MRVRFVADAIYETEGPGRGPLFRSGETHELRDDLAARWIRRKVAVPATDARPDAATIHPDSQVETVASTEPAERAPLPDAPAVAITPKSVKTRAKSAQKPA